ncbi:DUF6602 domain-containing protein [Saccharibacillus sacchari]|uniref:DUF6602 domain-containing protein n=1 Tax=Saccharibacillus sacchari TaxID=456493 RepID=UPI0004B12D27|nr:DUF6602 domain-containing protein [Saccharibacillus sacchari]
MESSFDTQKFVSSLGEELIYAFSKSGMTTHPHSVGSGRESAAKVKLEAILPPGIGIGSGFVIDSYGNTSAQCDIILYEQNYSLKFIINEDKAYTYYSCESVIAVGEIKSSASISDIEDSFKKIKRIRELKRRISREDEESNSFRKYFSSMSLTGTEEERYSQDKKQFDQIFTFILCKNLSTPLSSIKNKASEIFDDYSQYFNCILSIEDLYIQYAKIKNATAVEHAFSALEADYIFSTENAELNFNLFIKYLTSFIDRGRTVPLDYHHYHLKEDANINIKELINL